MTVQAVTCEYCKTMHNAEAGRYIVLSATVMEYGKPTNMDYDDPPEKQSVKVSDVAVCNNKCLFGLLSLKGF